MGRRSRSFSVSDSRSGVSAFSPAPRSVPRSLSSIPRYSRLPSGLVVNEDTGEILGNFPGRKPRSIPEAPLARVVPGPVVYQPPSRPRRPPGVPVKPKMADLRHPRLSVCIRRAIRRRVMFALGFSGRNGGTGYRRNAWSFYGC